MLGVQRAAAAEAADLPVGPVGRSDFFLCADILKSAGGRSSKRRLEKVGWGRAQELQKAQLANKGQ